MWGNIMDSDPGQTSHVESIRIRKRETDVRYLQFILRSPFYFSLFVIENKDVQTRCQRQTKRNKKWS